MKFLTLLMSFFCYFVLQSPALMAKTAVVKWPKIWMMDVTRTGNFCYNRSTDVKLWRANSKTPQTLLITDRKHKRKVHLRWSAKQNVLSWPHKKLPLKSNTVYLIQSGKQISTLTVNKLPVKLNQLDAITAWMDKKKCQHQLKILKRMKNPVKVFQK